MIDNVYSIWENRETVDSSAIGGAALYMWLVKCEESCAVTIQYGALLQGSSYGPTLNGEAQDPMRSVRAATCRSDLLNVWLSR